MEAAPETDKPTEITCPKCGWVSHNPNDIEFRYCGHCHEFHYTPNGEKWPSIEAQRAYWDERADIEVALTSSLREIDRLRQLLRSLPRSFGITEREITG